MSSAKQAILLLSRILNCLKITSLTAEDIRQAKYNGPVTTKLWKAVHSLVILHICRTFENGTCSRLARFMEEVQSEQAVDSLPPEAVHLSKSYLLSWGCPQLLVGRLHYACDSRPLLMAFGWLIHHCKLFEYWQSQQGATVDVQELMLSLLHDVSQQDAMLKAQDAEQNRQSRLRKGIQAACSLLHVNHQIEALAQSIPSVLGKIDKNNKQLTSLLEAHVRISHNVAAAQLQASSPLSQPTTRDKAPVALKRPLNLLELHLLGNADLLQAHLQKVQQGVQVLQQQQDCQHHARVFFEWMSSVVEEHQKSQAASVAHPACSTVRAHVDAQDSEGLLTAPIPVLAQQASFLWERVQQLPPPPAHQPTRASKPSANLSMYKRTPSAASRPQPVVQTVQLGLNDFSVAVLLRAPPHALEAVLRLPPDLATAVGSQPASQVCQGTVHGHARGAAAVVQHKCVLHEPKCTYQPEGTRVEGLEGRCCVDVKAETARVASFALETARGLARTRAAAKKKLIGMLAPIAEAEGLHVLGL